MPLCFFACDDTSVLYCNDDCLKFFREQDPGTESPAAAQKAASRFPGYQVFPLGPYTCCMFAFPRTASASGFSQGNDRLPVIYESVLNEVEEGVVISDHENRVIFINRAAEAIEGVDARMSLGKRMEELYLPVGNGKKKNSHAAVLNTGIAPNEHLNQYVVKSSHKIMNVEAISDAKCVARNQTTVLIYGETGTGKELFAQSIHNASPYQNGPFISVNCAAIPSTLLESMFFGTVKGSYTGAANTTGLFEQARNGTLFLDEINSMDISLQAKLLKVIENKTVRRIGDMKEREIRCRILCALNEAPLACIENGKLRRDLYYRLSSCILYIPPLRERKSDIPLLCSYFLKHFNKEYGRHIHRIDPELMDRFLEYPWPGNVRELQHVVESAFSVSRKDMEILQLGHLSHYYRDFFTASKPEAVSGSQAAPGPVSPRSPQPLKAYMDSCEKNFLAAALCSHNNNITATARSLQITRQALQHKIRKYGL